MRESMDNCHLATVRFNSVESTAHARALDYFNTSVAQERWHRAMLAWRSSRWNVGLMLGLLAGGWLLVAETAAAPVDEVASISSITVNPMANNRRAVILHGKTRSVSAYQGRDGFGHAVCGQGFILEDDTGSLDVLYLVRCHANETPTIITEGERVVIHATIDVSSDKLKNSEGKDILIKAMATKIVREK